MPDTTKRKAGALTPARRPNRRGDTRRLSKSQLKRVIAHIVAITPPARLFELYYWTQDPGLLKLLRSLARLGPNHRSALESFFQFAADRATVTAKIGPKGQLILEARHMNEAALMFADMLDDDERAPSTPKPH